MKHIDWDNVKEAKGFEKLPMGGYVCGITAVEDVPDKEQLKFEFDIAACTKPKTFGRVNSQSHTKKKHRVILRLC